MKKFTKLMLTGILAATAVAGVGCASSDKAADKPVAEQPAKKDDQSKQFQAAFAAAMIAESQLSNQFADKKGLVDGKETAFKAIVGGKTADQAVDFIATNYWSKDVAKKEFDAVLGDAALLEKANAALKAKAVADKKEDKFKPEALIADPAKLGKNALTGGKFEDAKAEEKDGKIVIDYKGLKYTLEKSGASYRIVAKEGKLAK